MKQYIIVDIDGTISKVGERIKYLNMTPPDWDSFYEDCFEDEPIQPIIDIVKHFLNDDEEQCNIFFFTGRRESAREKTKKWILDNIGIHGYEYCLFMREDGDNRHDTEVKPEFMKKAKLTIDDVAFILEDRNSMVKKWRELGFTCLQVADGDF